MKACLFALPLLLALMGASCAPPPANAPTSNSTTAASPAPSAIAPRPASTTISDPAVAPSQTSTIIELPDTSATGLQVASNKTAPDEVSRSCKTSADCAVKDVGNCCGAYPACVNKDSPTFPDRVKAQCGKEHRMGVCGFPVVNGCSCVAGKCETDHSAPPQGKDAR